MRNWILFCLITLLISCSGGGPHKLFPVVKDYHRGFINENGHVVIDIIYDSEDNRNSTKAYFYKGSNSKDFSDGLALMLKGDKFVYIDSTGKEVLEVNYDYAGDFHDGLAAFTPKEYGLSGYMDKKGKVVIKPQFRYAENFSEGRAFVQLDHEKNDWACIDRNGKVIRIFPDCDPAQVILRRFSEGLAAVPIDGAINYIDTAGNIVIAEKLEFGHHFKNGYAIAVKGNWGLIDKHGKFVIPPVYDGVGDYNNGLIEVSHSDFDSIEVIKYTSCYVNLKNDTIISKDYEVAYDFSEGLAAVRQNNKWGFIDTTGRIAINFQFDDVKNFSNGLAWFRNEKFPYRYEGYIDKHGHVVWSSE
jgi:hypothetical protein